ncbi:manganese catalase family protein [Salmonella enterica]|nr:manganese catalase family protein [Salmonella enterica]
MFRHVKQLQYTVRVSEPNPGLANLLLEQFGGPQGELAAACRYFTQGLSDDDAGRREMLMDIATEELSHLEIIGSLVGMLNKGAKGELAEGTENEAELYRSLTQNGNDSHITSLLYGGGPATVKLPREQMALLKAMAERTKSDPTVDPLTGAELGCGEPKEDK